MAKNSAWANPRRDACDRSDRRCASSHRGQKDRTVSFPVEHHGEAMKARIVLELLLARLVRHILFKPRNQIVFHDLQQSRVDGLTDDKEGLTVHGVYPIVRRRAQTSRCRAT